jgi:DNA-directed RNA polymerase
MSAFRNESTPQVYEGLNAINSTPWAINPTILRLQQQLWSEGGSVVGLPAADPLPLPPKPSDIAENKEARSQWKIEAHEVYSYNAKCQGQRAEFLQRLAVAEELAEEPEIYLPHQYDFRTRVYPIPVHLNHHQDSVGRSLLLFGRRVPVTDDGQRWLKINCANYYGLDKVPFDQRVNWVESHIDNLWEIFKNPIDRIEEWTKADKPWQYLAAICSLFDDDIAERMPVAVDGTCNGLQHYSAAGLDERGGAAVNLTPSDRPADVYSDVLEVVADRVGADARAGHAIAERIFGLLARNLVKAPVMTTPYNVTKVGARLQVAKELAKVGVGRKELYPSAKYLSEMVIDSIGDVCGKAIEIMKWIEDCVRAMCKHAPYETIRWTTPIGAPVVQPYRNPARHRVRTVLQDVILISDRSDTPVRLGKQVQGGPPNVVHSWDGTHNLSTAIECYDADIDYASVHDEYQAHASNIPQLNVILREQFILLHEQNLMGALHEEWSSQHPGLILPDPVTRGKLDLTAVMDSLYFFS